MAQYLTEDVRYILDATGMTIPEQNLFITAGQALSTVIDQVRAEHWELTTTPGGGFPGRTVREVVASHAKENRWVGHVLAGGTIEQGATLFPEFPEFPDTISGEEANARWREVTTSAAKSVLALGAPDRPVHLSFGAFGDFTARDYLHQIISYHTFEAWDLARLLGFDDTLPEDLVTGLAAIMSGVAEQWRGWGVFGPSVQVGTDASRQDQLLALVGRAP